MAAGGTALPGPASARVPAAADQHATRRRRRGTDEDARTAAALVPLAVAALLAGCGSSTGVRRGGAVPATRAQTGRGASRRRGSRARPAAPRAGDGSASRARRRRRPRTPVTAPATAVGRCCDTAELAGRDVIRTADAERACRGRRRRRRRRPIGDHSVGASPAVRVAGERDLARIAGQATAGRVRLVLQVPTARFDARSTGSRRSARCSRTQSGRGRHRDRRRLDEPGRERQRASVDRVRALLDRADSARRHRDRWRASWPSGEADLSRCRRSSARWPARPTLATIELRMPARARVPAPEKEDATASGFARRPRRRLGRARRGSGRAAEPSIGAVLPVRCRARRAVAGPGAPLPALRRRADVRRSARSRSRVGTAGRTLSAVHQLDDAGQHVGVGVGQHAVAEVEHVARAAARRPRAISRTCGLDRLPRREQERRVEVALQRPGRARPAGRPRRAAPGSRRPTTSAPASPIAASSSPVPTPKWIRGTPSRAHRGEHRAPSAAARSARSRPPAARRPRSRTAAPRWPRPRPAPAGTPR